MSKYVIWDNVLATNECSLTDFRGLEKTFPLLAGQSLIATFPDDASFSMDPDDSNDTLLSDSLNNTNLVIVASERLCNSLRTAQVRCVEYLPVTIYDHKSKPIDESYQIIHPIDPIDCLDLDNIDDVEYSPILPGQIDELSEIILLEGEIPEDRLFFRCLNYPDATIVERRFAEAITKAGFTGFEWCELEDFEP